MCTLGDRVVDLGLLGRPVVWLHGWGMSSAIWRAVPEFAYFDSHALSLPGHGFEAWDEALGSDITRWALWLLERAPPQAIWVGWSLGGLLALEVARLAPERVAGLCLLASSPCFTVREDWPCAMSAETFAQFEAGLAQDHALTLRRFLALQTVGADDAQRVRGLLNAAALDAASADVRALKAGLEMLRQADLRKVLAELRVPLAVMLGGSDRIVPPCIAELYRDVQPGVKVLTHTRAGHAPFLYAGEMQDDGLSLMASLEWMQEIAR
jgi:pimeloyl-[acyl-carrier protein] methyl ester esterase